MTKLNFLTVIVLLILLLGNAGKSYASDPNYFAPMHVDGSTMVTLDEAMDLYEQGVVFIDVRNSRLFKRKHITNAIHLDLKNGFDEAGISKYVKKHDPVVIYSSSVHCSRSYKAVAKAVSWGFSNVYYFRGGVVDWKQAGYPLTWE